MTDFLADIFVENACAALAVPVCNSLSLEAMWLFGQHTMLAPWCIAALAGLCGVLCSYLIGLGLDHVRQRHPEAISMAHYDTARYYALRFLSPLLLLYWVAPFMAVGLVMGLFRARWWLVVGLVLCGAALRVVWIMVK